MKQIQKESVIDLFRQINKEGLDSSMWSVDFHLVPTDVRRHYGSVVESDSVILQPGAYCAVWVESMDDVPSLYRWVSDKLSCDNFSLLFTKDETNVILICLDLL